MKRSIFFILILLSAPIAEGVEVKTYGNQTIVRPLGYKNYTRPPTGSHPVTILDHSISFSAQQVCGYTDWTTAVIKLPKELLSIKYWEKIGKNLEREAVNSVLAVTGALPSMLACNVSPTWCALMNRAEALAQANLKFNFDSCQILEGLNDATKKQFSSLKSCVQKQTSDGKASNTAQDSCMLNDQTSNLSKEEKAQNASAQSGASYDQNELYKQSCKDIHYPRYSSSTQAYSISELSCNWLKNFLPGVSMTASGTLRHGGTFSSSAAEKQYEDTLDQTGIFLVDMVIRMHAIRFGKGPYSSAGPLPRHLVIQHKDVWSALGVKDNGKLKGICYPEDGENCKTDIKQLPPVYRFSLVGGMPTLLVHPATLYEIVEIIPHGSDPRVEFEKKDSSISLILEHLIQAVAYAKTQDIVRDAYTRTVDACKKEPSLQSVGAQADCDAKLSKLAAEKESLRLRNETDRNHTQAQMQFYSELARLKGNRISIQKDGTERMFDPILDPKSL